MMIAVIDLIKNEWIPYEILHKLATNEENLLQSSIKKR